MLAPIDLFSLRAECSIVGNESLACIPPPRQIYQWRHLHHPVALNGMSGLARLMVIDS